MKVFRIITEFRKRQLTIKIEIVNWKIGVSKVQDLEIFELSPMQVLKERGNGMCIVGTHLLIGSLSSRCFK